MAEPPEPRHPEEGGGEDDPLSPEESRELDDFLDSEQFAELEDDMTLDRLGSGEEPSFQEYLAMDDDEAALTDEAANWRDEIDEEPLPPKLDTDAIIAEHERRKKAAEPPAPRAPHQEGNAGPMPLQESIGTLQGLSNDTSAAGSLQAASESLNTALAAAQSAVERLAEMAGQARTATEGNQNAAGEVGGTGEYAAGAIEDLIDAINQAVQAASQATEHENVFRNTCGSVAQRLQS